MRRSTAVVYYSLSGNTPLAEGGSGTLAYYRPWGNVVMVYDRFSSNSSLYELGEAISGEKNIGKLTGNISVQKVL